MNKILINFIVSFFMFVMIGNVNAADFTTNQKDGTSDKGSIVLRELLVAHQMLANSKQSDPDNMEILGSIVLIGEKKYEIVSFKFENTDAILSENSFEEYVKENNLLYMRSVVEKSPEGGVIEVFDSSRANLDNDISFNISLHPLDVK
jgi:hypothetical protein